MLVPLYCQQREYVQQLKLSTYQYQAYSPSVPAYYTYSNKCMLQFSIKKNSFSVIYGWVSNHLTCLCTCNKHSTALAPMLCYYILVPNMYLVRLLLHRNPHKQTIENTTISTTSATAPTAIQTTMVNLTVGSWVGETSVMSSPVDEW